MLVLLSTFLGSFVKLFCLCGKTFKQHVMTSCVLAPRNAFAGQHQRPQFAEVRGDVAACPDQKCSKCSSGGRVSPSSGWIESSEHTFELQDHFRQIEPMLGTGDQVVSTGVETCVQFSKEVPEAHCVLRIGRASAFSLFVSTRALWGIQTEPESRQLPSGRPCG